MNPRLRSLMLGGMAAWTVLTVAAGMYALQGTSAQTGGREQGARTPEISPVASRTAVASQTGVVSRTAVVSQTALARTATVPARATRTVPARTATPAGPEATGTAVPTFTATAAVATPTATISLFEFTPGPSPTPRVYAPPQYVQNAGADGAEIVGGRSVAAARDAALTPAKGVVVLDPGHGRGDPGAVHHRADGTPDVLEAEINLLNAQLIRDELVAMGYEVYLTRDDGGRGPDGPLVQQFITSDLIWRAQLPAAVDAGVFLALHGNGATVTSISGPETWYCGQHERGSANQRLAALVQQATVDSLREYGYFPPNRGIMEDAERHHSGDFCQFVVTRETTVASALLEHLFLSNDNDARVLADRRSHELLARHVAAAIDRFLTHVPGD